MTKKRSYRLIVLFSMVLVLFVNAAGAVLATSLDDIQNQIGDAKSQQSDIKDDIADIKSKLEQKKKESAAITSEMAAILAEKQEKASELQKLMDDLDYIYEQIDEFQTTIVLTEKNYNEALQLFYNRARVMYQYSQYDYLKLFTESKDIFDYAARSRLFARMMESDRAELENLEMMKSDLESKKKIQQQMQVDAEAAVADKKAIIAAIENNESDVLSKLNASRGAIDALEQQEEQMLVESERIAENIRALQSQYEQYTTNSDYDGKLIWPSNNSHRISSYFGMRMHPIYGYMRMHNGLDIAASYGTDIMASADGVITTVSYDAGGYGNYIVVYHGEGISTLYAHCSKIIATVGSTVKQGQVIAIVGSTGAATGPHIHYEVRENGTPVDPLGYVTP